MTDASELIFVGIDVSKATLEVALDDSSKTQTLGNDDVGVSALIARLKPLAHTVAVVLLEATGGLEQRAAAVLCANGFAVMVVNPRQAHDFAKALGRPTASMGERCRTLRARCTPASGASGCSTSCQRPSKRRCWRW